MRKRGKIRRKKKLWRYVKEEKVYKYKKKKITAANIVDC